jgi:ribosomal protein S3AE
MNDADVTVTYTIDDDGLHVSCFDCEWVAVVPTPATLETLREVSAAHQLAQHRSYDMLIGRYVEIEWQPHVEGATVESAEGLLTEIHDDDGETWLTLDWGYAISSDFITKIVKRDKPSSKETP